MRLLLSGGGTGGHVYPALAVVEELRKEPPGGAAGWALDAVLYVGTSSGLEAAIVGRAGIAFRAVRAAGVLGVSPWRVLLNGSELLRGTVQAWGVLREFRPSVVLATGGYASAPAVLAAWMRGRPTLIYLPDIEPGLAVRFLSRFARRVAVSFDPSLAYFAAGKGTVTGYPVRQALYKPDREGARQRLGLALDQRVVLVFGGSRAAHSINLAVHAALTRCLELAQVIHIAGETDLAWLQEAKNALPADLALRYHLHAYLHGEMVDALVSADLAVARAGAATMGEFAAAGLPSILVPYPYAGQHQEANADFLVSRGAAWKVPEANLPDGVLEYMLEKLLADREALHSMSQNARGLARPGAAQAIARELVVMSGGT